MQKEKFYKLADNPGLLNGETLMELQEITKEFPYFQAARILCLKNFQVTGNPGFEAALKKTAISIPDRRALHRFLFSDSGTQASSYYFEQSGIHPGSLRRNEGSESAKGDTLIDKFLSSDPAPIKMEKKYMPEESSLETHNEMVTKSVSESEEMITETLAMILFEQKKYDKALDAFKKLSLKYPEKSVYFATRIEEIEKLKNI